MPVCVWVAEPLTFTLEICDAGTPSRLICVRGLASSDSGSGETASGVPGRMSERLSTLGTQRDAAGAGAGAAALGAPTPSPSAPAPASTAMAFPEPVNPRTRLRTCKCI